MLENTQESVYSDEIKQSFAPTILKPAGHGRLRVLLPEHKSASMNATMTNSDENLNIQAAYRQ